MLKHPHLTFQHRAGVRPNTSSFDLAESCVFIKQSLPPILCHLKKVSLIKAPFIPKLQGHFAEFLQGGSLKRLSLLDSSTCVGLGYGLFTTVFSWETLNTFKYNQVPVTNSGREFFYYLLPISYDFRLYLRDRLTLRGLAFRRNPWTYGENVYTFFIVTHVSIIYSGISRVSHNTPSTTYRTFRYLKKYRFGTYLEPLYIFGAKKLDQWAVTLSLKGGCFQAYLLVVFILSPPFSLRYDFGTLTSIQGCFPFDHGP